MTVCVTLVTQGSVSIALNVLLAHSKRPMALPRAHCAQLVSFQAQKVRFRHRHAKIAQNTRLRQQALPRNLSLIHI